MKTVVMPAKPSNVLVIPAPKLRLLGRCPRGGAFRSKKAYSRKDGKRVDF